MVLRYKLVIKIPSEAACLLGLLAFLQNHTGIKIRETPQT